MPRVLPNSLLRSLRDLPTPLKLDITQFALDLFGILDPTPISDGLNGFISLCRGDFLGAAVSAVSIIPGADVAKVLRLEKYVLSLKSLVVHARQNILVRSALADLMKTLRTLVDKLPASEVTIKLRNEIDMFLRLPQPPQRFTFPTLKHRSPAAVRQLLRDHGFSKVRNADGYRIASSRGTAVGPKEIWSKYDGQSDGYFVIRMDPQGHATKTDFGPGNISVVSQRRNGEFLSHGGRPHYHKEWVTESKYEKFTKGPLKHSEKYSVKFDDTGEISTDIKGTHIPR